MLIQPIGTAGSIATVQICHPKYEEARVIRAILDDSRFENLDEPILEIQKNENGYLVITASYEMQVDVKYLPPLSHVVGGHRQFELIFNDPKISHFGIQALPPKYQIAREIRAILDDCRLYEKLGNEVIQGIRKTEGGYVIATRSFEFQVDVNYLSPSTPGIIGEPARFELVFQDPVYSPNIVS